MACIKCGKKTQEEQCFCDRCLSVMEAYPVKQDVRIQLPNRPVIQETKKSGRRRRALSAEEQLPILRRRVRRLRLVALALVVLLGVAVFLLVKSPAVKEKAPDGQNYTVDETAG